MKRLLSMLVISALLCLCACGEVPAPEETTAAQTTLDPTRWDEVLNATEPPEPTEPETTTKYYPPPKPPKTVNTEYAFTSTWAKTPTHFYAVMYEPVPGGGEWDRREVLYRFKLNDITKAEKIPLPETHKGNALSGVGIVGVKERELFVSRGVKLKDGGYPPPCVTYRVSLDAHDFSILDEGKYYNVPHYNSASDSLLFAYKEGTSFQLEAMQLANEKRSIIYEFSSINNDTGADWEHIDGMVIFINNSWGAMQEDADYILIDAENSAQPIAYEKVFSQYHKTLPKAIAQENLWTHTALGDRIYYVTNRNFYWINADGSGKKLLREKTNIYQLTAAGGQLFAMADDPTRTYNDSYGEPVSFYILNEEGKVAQTLAREWIGENGGIGLHKLEGTDIVIMMDGSF